MWVGIEKVSDYFRLKIVFHVSIKLMQRKNAFPIYNKSVVDITWEKVHIASQVMREHIFLFVFCLQQIRKISLQKKK